MTATPVIDGWFTTDAEPQLLATRCTSCSNVVFPPVSADAGSPAFFCRNPACDGTEHDTQRLSRRGTVWSYTDAQYQPPAPYIAPNDPDDPFEPFALAAVELPEGLVVLGQVAAGFGVDDLTVGGTVELVVETLNVDETGERTIYRWKPVTTGSTEVSA